jgi:uncharacterized protein (TIGR02271 family)
VVDPQNPAAKIATGATVFDDAGEKVGTVAELNEPGSYLLVQKGWLFHKDFYVPFNAVTRVDELGGIYLNVNKQDLHQGYDYPPADNVDTGTTIGGATTTTGSTGVDTSSGTAAGGVDTGSARGGSMADATTTGVTGTDEMRIPVREEELVGGTRMEQEGTVHIHKDVVEEQQTINVPLQREQVTVDRVPLKGDVDPATLDETAFTKRVIDVPLMDEQPVVGKRLEGVEEIRVNKDTVVDNQPVSDTVRKERVTVEGADDSGDQTSSDTTPKG